MIKFFKTSLKSAWVFFKCREVPFRDRLLIFLILLSIVSPLDLIPDSIPGIGVVDDLFFIAVLYDFAFKVLDRDLALRIYQGEKSGYERLEKLFAWLNWFRPAGLFRSFWKTKRKITEVRR